MKKKPYISLYKDGTAYFGLLDIDLKPDSSGSAKHSVWRYILQACLGGLFVAISILLLEVLVDEKSIRPYILTSIAASTFLVFGAPGIATSKPKRVFWGHFIGAVTGMIICLSIGSTHSENIGWASLISVFIALLLMTALDVEHPPAAGTALAIATYAQPDDIIIPVLFILFAATLLGVIRWFFYECNGFKAMKGLGNEVLEALKENGVLTINDLSKSSPDEIYKILKKTNLTKYYCRSGAEQQDTNKEEYCPTIKSWITQAKEQQKQNLSMWTLRDLF